MGAVTGIPKADQMSGSSKRETAAKAAKCVSMKKKHGTEPGGMDNDGDPNKSDKYVDEADIKGLLQLVKKAKKTNVRSSFSKI